MESEGRTTGWSAYWAHVEVRQVVAVAILVVPLFLLLLALGLSLEAGALVLVSVFILYERARRRRLAHKAAEELLLLQKRREEQAERRAEDVRRLREQAETRRLAEERRRVEEERRRIESLLHRDAVADQINYMSGLEFERFMADLFRQKGYAVEATRTTGDQGVDLVLPDIGGKRVAVQLKRWTGPVGNAAVQATFAGMAHYRAQEGWIITTSTFTRSARELARSTSVRLIDGEELSAWLEGLAEDVPELPGRKEANRHVRQRRRGT